MSGRNKASRPLEGNDAQVLFGVHSPDECAGERCAIHNRSQHVMRRLPQIWRSDRRIIERVCTHGVGHPDPDYIDYVRRTRGAAWAEAEMAHGCDGCCRGAY